MRKGDPELIVEDGRVVSYLGIPPYGLDDEGLCVACEAWHAMRTGLAVPEGTGQLVRAVMVDRSLYACYNTRIRRVVEAVD